MVFTYLNVASGNASYLDIWTTTKVSDLTHATRAERERAPLTIKEQSFKILQGIHDQTKYCADAMEMNGGELNQKKIKRRVSELNPTHTSVDARF